MNDLLYSNRILPRLEIGRIERSEMSENGREKRKQRKEKRIEVNQI